jgi:protein phosphatase
MGTTLVAALLEDAALLPHDPSAAVPGPTLWLAHVGDSRCYLFRRGALHLLTQDHSLVEEQFRAGLISRLQAATSPIRNIITRAVGSQPSVEPDIAAHAAYPGDLFLLASDGLSRELDDDAIARILGRVSGPPLEPPCQALVDAANAHGGRDNITVLLIACL